MELADSGIVSPQWDISLTLTLAPATVPTAGSRLVAFYMSFFTGDAARSYFVCACTGPLRLLWLSLLRTQREGRLGRRRSRGVLEGNSKIKAVKIHSLERVIEWYVHTCVGDSLAHEVYI